MASLQTNDCCNTNRNPHESVHIENVEKSAENHGSIHIFVCEDFIQNNLYPQKEVDVFEEGTPQLPMSDCLQEIKSKTSNTDTEINSIFTLLPIPLNSAELLQNNLSPQEEVDTFQKGAPQLPISDSFERADTNISDTDAEMNSNSTLPPTSMTENMIIIAENYISIVTNSPEVHITSSKGPGNSTVMSIDFPTDQPCLNMIKNIDKLIHDNAKGNQSSGVTAFLMNEGKKSISQKQKNNKGLKKFFKTRVKCPVLKKTSPKKKHIGPNVSKRKLQSKESTPLRSRSIYPCAVPPRVKEEWKGELETKGYLICPIGNCLQVFFMLISFLLHLKTCTKKYNRKFCQYCCMLIEATDENVFHHMTANHPDELAVENILKESAHNPPLCMPDVIVNSERIRDKKKAPKSQTPKQETTLSILDAIVTPENSNAMKQTFKSFGKLKTYMKSLKS